MSREVVSLNMDSDVVRQVDTLVGKKYRNRSQAFETLINDALRTKAVDTAIVLCGGKGTRLRPITESIPKPMVEVNGKPILEHVIAWLKSYGVSSFILATGYKHEVIEDYFKDGAKFGVNILYSQESEDAPLGTGGAIKRAAKLVNSTFIMANADVLTNFNVRDMVDTHKRNGAMLTVALKPVKDPSRFGIAELEGTWLRRFVEKPAQGTAPSNLANAGVMVIEPEALSLCPEKPHHFESMLFPQLAEKKKLAGYPFTGPWVDVGIHDSLDKARDIW